MSDAFQKYGVDRNTIDHTAAIAELAIAAPEKYAELLQHQEAAVALAVCNFTTCIALFARYKYV